MKRILCFIAAAVFLFSSCTALYDSNDSPDGEYETENYDDCVKLTIPLRYLSKIPEDIELVENEINKITSEKIGVVVEIIPLTSSDASSTISMMEKEDRYFDLNTGGTSGYKSFIQLDSLLAQYGTDILDAFTEEELSWGQVDEKQYLIPTKRDYVHAMGVTMRKDILDKYEIDASTIRSLEDLDRLYDFISVKEPQLKMTAPQGLNFSFLFRYSGWEELSTGVAILADEPSTVVSLYETDEYEYLIRMIRGWYLKGYLPDELNIQKFYSSQLVKADKLFSYFQAYKPGIDVEESMSSAHEMVTVCVSEPVMNNNSITTFLWGITSKCKYPIEAMKLLNLLYSDSDVMNLLNYGIEGRHYEILDDGTIDYPEGVTAANSRYNPAVGWILPNQFITYVWHGNDLDLWEDIVEFNNGAKRANSFGFYFDSSEVYEQTRNVVRLYYTYVQGLEMGLLDPDSILPVLREKLHEAGIDDIVASAQQQYEKWLKEGE